MRTSESTKNIYSAIARAQAKIESVAKDAANPHFKSRYATLGNIVSQVRPAANAEGIAIMQYVDGEALATRCTHSESGEWIESHMPLVGQRSDMQKLGSATTYAARYSLALLFCVAIGDFDDDGNENAGKGKSTLAQSNHAQADQSVMGSSAFDALMGLIAKCETQAAALTVYNVNKNKMSLEQQKTASTAIRSIVKKEGEVQ